jgi:hypothetical protein
MTKPLKPSQGVGSCPTSVTEAFKLSHEKSHKKAATPLNSESFDFSVHYIFWIFQLAFSSVGWCVVSSRRSAENIYCGAI